ncbi:MAG: hypothetical protein WKG01_20690 [Kofleriaceae bacterium]
MWIVIRLILAAIGFAIRRLRRASPFSEAGRFEGAPYSEQLHKAKNAVRGFTIGMQRASPTWVRLHAESAIDRICKWLGISNELQTGDTRFDTMVYVTCDHPHVHALLRDSLPLRAAILAAFDDNYQWIRFDGQSVQMRRNATTEPKRRDLALLKAVADASEGLEADPPPRLADPFLWKALVVEGVIWSLLGYAIGAFIESRVHTEDYHLWHGQVVKAGMIVAVAAFAILLGIIALWMRGSSRGHRVIVESAIVLVLGLPISAIQLVGDTNRALDGEPAIPAVRKLETCEQRKHHKKHGYYYTYHLWLASTPELEGPRLPRVIEVPERMCGRDQATVRFEIGPGRWGIPWYRTIEIDGVVWTNPL